jgi:hypothetical protein
LEDCNREVWNAAEGAVEEDAEIVIDMKCPIKLQEIQIMNGVGDFSTKRFTVFGSGDSRGPWTWLYSGGVKEGRDDQAETSPDNCSMISFSIPMKDSFKFEKSRFFKYQVDSFYGKGGGLQFLKLLGTRLGGVY